MGGKELDGPVAQGDRASLEANARLLVVVPRGIHIQKRSTILFLCSKSPTRVYCDEGYDKNSETRAADLGSLHSSRCCARRHFLGVQKRTSAAIPESGSTFPASASAPLNPHSLRSRHKAHLPIRARKQDPPLAVRTFLAKTSLSSIRAAISSHGTGKVGTLATTRFFRPASKSI